MPNYYLLPCTQDPHRVRVEAQSHPERARDKTVSDGSSQLPRLRCEGLTLAGGVIQHTGCQDRNPAVAHVYSSHVCAPTPDT